MREEFTTRLNVMTISSVSEFSNVKGGLNGACRDVYFYRLVGTDRGYGRKIQDMDNTMNRRRQDGKVFYKRIRELPRVGMAEEMKEYTRIYEAWEESGRTEISFPCMGDSDFLEALCGACVKAVRSYRRVNASCSESQEKNFLVKLLFWLDASVKEFLPSWSARMNAKMVFENISKKQEYLFCYLLTLLGFDVLLLQYRTDIDEELEQLAISGKLVLGSFSDVSLPEYTYRKRDMPRVQIPERRRTRASTAPASAGTQRNPAISASSAVEKSPDLSTRQVRKEKTYEELALLSSSVVLIAIHDQRGDVIGTGSGIMINRDGYVLTNNHVANGGVFYSVKIEDDDQVYQTDEIIKYNPNLDLAILRIDRQLTPLPIYNRAEKLVRGQKVVAIGSPLGLFNSISDGIIAGFRKIDDVGRVQSSGGQTKGAAAIQFTAPISHGSSGGAVLNMYGEVIGISTAGFDGGQNINLAMDYECIRMFAKGFL